MMARLKEKMMAKLDSHHARTIAKIDRYQA
jgi:hypothetical protein